MSRQYRCAVAFGIAAILALITSLANPSPAAADKTAEPSLKVLQMKRIMAAIDGHVIPRLGILVASAESLAGETTSYCKNGQPDHWVRLRASFAKTVVAWATVSHLQFGPIVKNARAQRVSFWPDPRSIVWRQLKRVVAKQDESLLVPGAIGNQSVALQGLSALELLLDKKIPTGDGATASDSYKCKLAAAIADNVVTITQTEYAEWKSENGWRATWLSQHPNADETSHSAAMTALVKSVLTGLQVIREQQVLILQKTLTGEGKTSRLPYFRSGLSTLYLRASVEGTCELLGKIDLGYFAPKDMSWIKAWLPDACRILNQRAANTEIPKSKHAFPGKLDAFDLRQLRFYTNSLRQIIGRQIAPLAGLTIGFNELDGD